MTMIEIVLLVAAALAGLIAWQAHKNGLSFSAEAKADLATAKSDATTAVHALELRVVALETKIGLVKAAAPAPAPAPASTASTPPASPTGS